MKKNKYNNKKTVIDGHKFDSRKEGDRYCVLRTRLNMGEIEDLRLQPRFKIADGGMVDPQTGRKMADRYYVADFSYTDKSGKTTVEDVKSAITSKESTYRLKRHLFLMHYGDDCVFLEK